MRRNSRARWRNHDGRFVPGRAPEVGTCEHPGCGKLTMPDYDAATDASGFIDPFKVALSRRFCREHRTEAEAGA